MGSNAPPLALGEREGLLRIAGVAIGVFVELRSEGVLAQD